MSAAFIVKKMKSINDIHNNFNTSCECLFKFSVPVICSKSAGQTNSSKQTNIFF